MIHARATINGGLPVSGGLTISAGDSVQPMLASYDGVGTILWEIYSYPEGFGTPAGWSAATGRYWWRGTSGVSLVPPAVSFSGAPWGKYLFRVTSDSGIVGSAINLDETRDETLAVQILGPNDLEDAAPLETNQFDSVRLYQGAVQRALRKLLAGVAGVSSWNSRTGAVVPIAGDYDSDDITNVSTVTGVTVSDALDFLLTLISGVGGSLVSSTVAGLANAFPGSGAKAVFTSNGSTAGGAWVSVPANSTIARQAGNVVALTPGSAEQALMYRSSILQFASVYDLPNGQDVRWMNGATSAYMTAFDVQSDDILRIGANAVRVNLATQALGFFGKTPTATSAPSVTGDDAESALGSLLTALSGTLGLITDSTTGLGSAGGSLPTECVLQFDWESPEESCTIVRSSVATVTEWTTHNVSFDGAAGDDEIGLICTTDSADHYISYEVDDFEPGYCVFRVCARPETYNWVCLAGEAGGWYVWFNITLGTVGTITDPSGHVVDTAITEDVALSAMKCQVVLNTSDTTFRIYPCSSDGALTAPVFATAACWIQAATTFGPGVEVEQTRVMRAENRHPWLRNTYGYRSLLTDPASNTNEEQPVVANVLDWESGGLTFGGQWTPGGLYGRYLEIQDMAGGYDLIRQLSGPATPFAAYFVLARRDSSGSGTRRLLLLADATESYTHSVHFDQATDTLVAARAQPGSVSATASVSAPPDDAKSLCTAYYNGKTLTVGVGASTETPVEINPTSRIEFSQFTVGGNPDGTVLAATQSECTIYGLYVVTLPPGAVRTAIDPGSAIDLAVRAAIAARHGVTTS